MCVWLAGLASYRQGLTGRLLRAYGDPAALIDADPAQLRTLLAELKTTGKAPSGARRNAANRRQPAPSFGGPCEAPVQAATGDAAAFRSLLDMSPAECLTTARRQGGSLVTWVDSTYPDALRQLADPPLCLFVGAKCPEQVLTRRLRALSEQPIVAIVGSRSPSPYGEEMATLLGRDLAAHGALVVSGLAMGIDALAHSAALSADPAGEGVRTIAVLGCGADVTYPLVNRRLFTAVAHSGLLISEFLWGVAARAWRFPARNRVMAGLAHAVVVVEGSKRSGARLTADFALDLGREVLAVPGEAGRRLSAAPHALLRQGAAFCESADDVLGSLAHLTTLTLPANTSVASDQTRLSQRISHHAALVLATLDGGAATADQIAERAALPSSAVNIALAELEIDGRVARQGGGAYRLQRL